MSEAIVRTNKTTVVRPDRESILEEKWKLNRYKTVTTFGIYYTAFVYGGLIGFFGPAILFLTRKFETDIQSIVILFSIISAAHLLTALVFGLLFNSERGKHRHRRPLTVAALLIWTCVALYILPHTASLYLFYAFGAAFGVGLGIFDVSRDEWIRDLWDDREKARCFTLIQHVAVSFGMILPPIIWAPFLSRENMKDRHFQLSHDQGQVQADLGVLASPGQNPLIIPCSVAGFILSIAVAVQLAIFLKFRGMEYLVGLPKRKEESETSTGNGNESGGSATPNRNSSSNPIPISNPDENPGSSKNIKVQSQRPEEIEMRDRSENLQTETPSTSSNSNQNRNNGPTLGANFGRFDQIPPPPPPLPILPENLNGDVDLNLNQNLKSRFCWPQCFQRQQFFVKSLTLWLILMSASYTALELTTLNFLPLFAYFSPVHLSEFRSCLCILGTFTVAHALGRILTSHLVKIVSCEVIVTGNLMLILLANLLWRLMGENDSLWLIIGSIFMGLGLSTMYPALQVYFEKFSFINPRLRLTTKITEVMLTIFFPLIIGHSIESFSAIFIWINFLSLSVLTTAFVKFQILTAFMAYYGLDENCEMNTVFTNVKAYTQI